MALDITGIDNSTEFYSGHYLSAVLEGDLKGLFASWKEAEERGEGPAPFKRFAPVVKAWEAARQRAAGEPDDGERFRAARASHVALLEALGYPYAPDATLLDDGKTQVPLVAAIERAGTPYLWIVDAPFPLDADAVDALDTPPLIDQYPGAARTDAEHLLPPSEARSNVPATWRELLDTTLFQLEHPPRWILFLAGDSVTLAERHKWGAGRFLRFDLAELLTRRDPKALKAATALLHRDALAPGDGGCLHDTLEEKSHRHAFSVSGDLKHGVRRAVELLGNEAVRYRREVQKRGVFDDPDLAEKLKDDCLTYMYRLLFLLFVEARGAELGVVPMGSDAYRTGYSLESLRDLELVPLTTERARSGFFLHDSLQRLFTIVNSGFPVGEVPEDLFSATAEEAMALDALRAPLFDDGRLRVLRGVRFRNVVLQEVIRLLSLSRRGARGGRGRISYAQLGISQLGSVYESLLSYTGFFADEEDGLYEVASKKDAKALSEANKAGGAKEGASREDVEVHHVPASEADRYGDDEFVRDAAGRRVRHARGTFIYALAGRSRESSASYYTPEVLTECVVKYALKELLEDEDGAPKRSADEILQLSVCEPAMGSGAFLIEAIDQLADAYLARRQEELDQTLPSDRYLAEKRRVKARLATNNCYGVDLNPVAVELAQVSLWLGSMAEGTKCPWFGLRLASGNSLVGARREVFQVTDLTRKGGKATPNWLGMVPERVPLRPEGGPSPLDPTWRVAKRPAGTVYHFLAPAMGMAAFDKDKVVKQLAPEGAKHIAAWRKEFTKPFSAADAKRLERLSDAVDRLWSEVVRERALAAAETTDRVPVWGEGDGELAGGAGGPEVGVDVDELGRALSPRLADGHIEVRDQEVVAQALEDESSAYRRLSLVMDAWCALWFWPIEQAALLPSRQEWLAALELALVGEAFVPEHRTQGLLFAGVNAEEMLPFESAAALEDLGSLRFADSTASAVAERVETVSRPASAERVARLKALSETFADRRRASAEECGISRVDEVVAATPWLKVAEQVKARQRFHHWELRFAEVYGERGGFDLILGNPPWIKLQWNEAGILSEFEPRLALDGKSAAAIARRRGEVLGDSAERRSEYLGELGAMQGARAFLNAEALYPLLKGQQTNLYKCFLSLLEITASPQGLLSIVHQKGLYDDPKGGRLRRWLSPRLASVLHFSNKKLLFDSITDQKHFEVTSVRSAVSPEPAFRLVANLFHPSTLDKSMVHDGFGSVPGLKDADGEFDLRGHRNRIIDVDEESLALFASLYDEPGTHPHEARLPVVHSTEIVDVLRRFAAQPRKLGDLRDEYFATVMIDEDKGKKDGTIAWENRQPRDATEWILQGPHFYVGTPFNKTPNQPCKHNQDYTSIDLTSIPPDFLPRTNYVPACDPTEYARRTPKWKGRPVTEFFRHVHRRMVSPTGERTLVAAIAPPGLGHGNSVLSVAADRRDLVLLLAASTFSLPVDFLLKVSGKGDVYGSTLIRIPLVRDEGVLHELRPRVLELVCLTEHYAPLWVEGSRTPLACSDERLPRHVGPVGAWKPGDGARVDLLRRQLLVEIDVLVALSLGMSVDELETIYRVQFPVLQQYERENRYDQHGRLVPTSGTASGRDAVSLMKLAALLEKEAGFDIARPYEPGAPETEALLSHEVKLSPRDAAVLGVPPRCPLTALFTETEVTYHDHTPGAPAPPPTTKTLLALRYTDPGLYPEKERTYPTPWTTHNRESDYRTAWKALEARLGREGLGPTTTP